MSIHEAYPTFEPFLAYSASAGSGKTFTLSARYIALLFMGESAGSILAATFTNKAAAEMRQRVISLLQNLETDSAFLGAVLEQTGLSQSHLLAKQPEVLAKFLATGNHIVTLDSFFSSILRSASLEIGLEPDFVTKAEGEENLEMYFLENLKERGLLLNLVKLSMDIEDKRFTKIFDLMQNFYTIDPLLPLRENKVHRLSEQEAHCEELRLKLIKALQDASATARAVKQFETQDIKALFIKKLFEFESLGEHSWFKKVANAEIEGLYAFLKTALSTWATMKEGIVFDALFHLYEDYKNATISNAKQSGVLTFDDLTYFTYRLLYEGISTEFLYFKIDAKFKHILLDEFQDTSTLQFLLLEPLIKEIFSGKGQSEFRSFFYVGDTKQSLYRFRGGVEELFDKVAQNYTISIKQMDTNYRSRSLLVDQVNHWFQDVMKGYIPQKSKKDVEEGYVAVVESETLIDEAVNQAKRLLDRGIDVDDIAFLVSTNKDGQTLQEACYKVEIDTRLKTSSSLKNIPKIAALVAMSAYLFYGRKIDAVAVLYRVGKKLDEVDLEWFSAFMSPLQVLDRLIKTFGYFNEDLNILNLLEFAMGFSDIPSFIEEFEKSTLPVASNTVHGAKIMTIHGSKGLEFKYVILLDKLTKKKSDSTTVMFHYKKDLSIESILYRMKGRENFDSNYAQKITARKISTAKDGLNVLYVALTRGVEGLIVIRKPKESIFDVLDMAVMQRGTINVSQKKPTKEQKQNDTIVLCDYGTQERVQQEKVEEKDYIAILFGTALHYGLEMLGDFDTLSVAVAMTAVQNKFGQQLTVQQQEEIERRINSLVTDKNFQGLLINAKIRKEQSLSFEGELKQIDLLLEYAEHNLVIDYKSSKKYAFKHQNQVGYYKKAIANITKKKTKGIVVYVLESGIEFQLI